MILLMVVMVDVCMYIGSKGGGGGRQRREGEGGGYSRCEGPGAKQEGSVRLQAGRQNIQMQVQPHKETIRMSVPSFGTS